MLSNSKLNFFLFLIISFVLLACSLFASGSNTLQATIEALEIKQTQVAGTVVALTETAASATLDTTTPSNLQNPVKEPTQTLAPTVVSPENSDQVMERRIKSAKILLFEDMSASGHVRYVKKALDEAGYFYLDVGSAKGWFKSQLLGQEDWDLVIAAAEARRPFGGEFFEYIYERVDQGSGAVVEFWDIDDNANGKIKPLLDACGVEFHLDWFEPELRSVFWFQPDHPVRNEPNKIPNHLGSAPPLWPADLGDLLRIKPQQDQNGGNPVLLAGTDPSWKTDHATLVSCLDGRLIIQTFGSHEVQSRDMIPLWQNYVYNTLKSHYTLTPPGESLSTPVVMNSDVSEETPDESLNPLEQVGGIGNQAECGSIFIARVFAPPKFQQDLFEHHASGTFLYLTLELINKIGQDIQIWDDDYFIEAILDGEPVIYTPDKAATGYLYITEGGKLSQDVIEPGEIWRTNLAFDVDPDGEGWTLVVKPGSEVNQSLCEVRISLIQ